MRAPRFIFYDVGRGIRGNGESKYKYVRRYRLTMRGVFGRSGVIFVIAMILACNFMGVVSGYELRMGDEFRDRFGPAPDIEPVAPTIDDRPQDEFSALQTESDANTTNASSELSPLEIAIGVPIVLGWPVLMLLWYHRPPAKYRARREEVMHKLKERDLL